MVTMVGREGGKGRLHAHDHRHQPRLQSSKKVRVSLGAKRTNCATVGAQSSEDCGPTACGSASQPLSYQTLSLKDKHRKGQRCDGFGRKYRIEYPEF